MSRTKPLPVEDAQLKYRCDYCGADPGEWCSRVGFRVGSLRWVWSAILHSPRFYAAKDNGDLPLTPQAPATGADTAVAGAPAGREGSQSGRGTQ